MVALQIAIRTLARRKVRMLLIGLLVMLGTILIIFGETFTLSAGYYSKRSIIDHFTGDIIIYSNKAKEKPSPFSFTTPLPIISDPSAIESWLDSNNYVKHHVAIAQNYGLMSIDNNGKKQDVPFVFYAVDPKRYTDAFPNIDMIDGSFLDVDNNGPAEGVVLSEFQVKNYRNNYSTEIKSGDKVTLLSLSDGGSVNALPSVIAGVYKPKYYSNVFNYINFINTATYAKLYNFTGVQSESMPQSLNNALKSESEDDIFGLADASFDSIATSSLVKQELTGYTLIAVQLNNASDAKAFVNDLSKKGFAIKTADWKESSGFFAYIADTIRAVIYSATFLIFLIVVFILMNTMIINVLERTGEIGTLRAIGGEKSFIMSIFLAESFILNGIAALAGAIISLVLILLFRSGIMLPDIIQQYLTGGGVMPLLLSPQPFIEALAVILAVSTIATLYPIKVATAITPLKAMSVK
jgi:putative ABC transport system permease protein